MRRGNGPPADRGPGARAARSARAAPGLRRDKTGAPDEDQRGRRAPGRAAGRRCLAARGDGDSCAVSPGRQRAGRRGPREHGAARPPAVAGSRRWRTARRRAGLPRGCPSVSWGWQRIARSLSGRARWRRRLRSPRNRASAPTVSSSRPDRGPGKCSAGSAPKSVSRATSCPTRLLRRSRSSGAASGWPSTRMTAASLGSALAPTLTAARHRPTTPRRRSRTISRAACQPAAPPTAPGCIAGPHR